MLQKVYIMFSTLKLEPKRLIQKMLNPHLIFLIVSVNSLSNLLDINEFLSAYCYLDNLH